MSFRSERKKYIDDSNISIEEADYNDNDNNTTNNINCKYIKETYIKKCDKTTIITNIDIFFDNNWYNTFNSKIANIIDYTEIKELMSKLLDFKTILKIHKNIDINEKLQIEDDLINCIKNRIIYKYRCTLKETRNKGHDIEILKQIFHHKKLKELKELFMRINNKYIEFKEQINARRTREDLQRRQEDEIDLFLLKKKLATEERLSSEESSNLWKTVIKKKKNSRKKH